MGKLGIIFAFLLSVAAAAGSFYLYQGWVEENTVRVSVEAKYDQVREKISIVQSEKDQFKAKSEEYRTKAEAVQSQMEKFQAEQKRIDSEKAVLETKLKGHQAMIAELQSKVGELEKKAKDAQAACGVSPTDLKTDIISAPQAFDGGITSAGTVTEASSSGDADSQLVFKPVTSGAVASAPVASPVSSTSTSSGGEISPVSTPVVQEVSHAQPSVDVPLASGPKVLTVNRKFNFVVINQGLQDGLKMGDRLRVLKQGQENATIQVEKLYDKFSAATLIEEDPKQQVVEGDEIRKI